MTMMYIYALAHKGEVFYVGASKNPAARLLLHWRGAYLEMAEYISKIESVQDIDIRILQEVKCKAPGIDQRVSQIEFYWVNKYLIEGHPLKNKLIKRSSLIRLNYYKQIIKNNNGKRIRTTNNKGTLRTAGKGSKG